MGYEVALSYGHGENTYRETGSKGVTVNGVQYPEHKHNYEVGVRVKAILQQHGVSVLEVQPPNGRDVPLRTRTDQANAAGVKLYYSIHSNAGANRGYCGFYWGTSTESKRLAEIYREEIQAAGFPLYAGGTYASKLDHWTNFHELRETHMNALLTENGFMTSPDDFPLIFLNVNGSWEKEALAHAKTILRFLGRTYVVPQPAAPVSTATRHVKIVNVSSAAILMDKPDRLNSTNIGTIPLGTIVDMIVPVTGYNNPEGYFKVVYQGKTGYINAKYGIEV